MTEPIIIDLLRHGEVEAEGWAFRGSTDLPLSETGWQQMRAVGACLSNMDQIVTSPLQRCRLFAQELQLQQSHSLSHPLCMLDDMREMDFGDWENKSFDELNRLNSLLLHKFWDSPVGIQPPNGEAFDAFAQRVIACWEAWVADLSVINDGAEHRLLVAHGGVIRVLLAHIMDMPMSALWRLHLPYASWNRVSLCAGHQPRVMFMNKEP